MWWYQYAGSGKGIRPRASDGAAGGTDGSYAFVAGAVLFGTRMRGILHCLGRGPCPECSGGYRARRRAPRARVIDGVTGFHRADSGQFAEAAVSLLTDDALWRRQHEACHRHCQGIDWPEAAARFEAALLSDAVPTYASSSDS